MIEREKVKEMFESAIRREMDKAAIDISLEMIWIEFHWGREIRQISFNDALEAIYGDGNSINPIIDVALLSTSNKKYNFFVRPSGYSSNTLEKTWDPSDMGPFRAIGPLVGPQ